MKLGKLSWCEMNGGARLRGRTEAPVLFLLAVRLRYTLAYPMHTLSCIL